jgi:hypothetical protein
MDNLIPENRTLVQTRSKKRSKMQSIGDISPSIKKVTKSIGDITLDNKRKRTSPTPNKTKKRRENEWVTGKTTSPIMDTNLTTKSPIVDATINENLTRLIHNNRSRKIQKFFKQTDTRRKELFLKSICSDSGMCIAFGIESKKIKQFFDNFERFNYVTKTKMIGENSMNVNGKLYEIEYNRNNYIAHAVLKTTTKPTADNLVYEYLVGKFINKFSIIYPCFLETYQLFLTKESTTNATSFSDLKIKGHVTYNEPMNSQILNTLLAESCLHGTSVMLLIQHINEAKTLAESIKTGGSSFLEKELLYVLLQVYLPLYSMSQVFTHHDLHSHNVLLYEPVKGAYIQYHYHIGNGKTIRFKSRYIAKIIDYGRCWFYDIQNGNLNSKLIHDIICNLNACQPNCGNTFGYTKTLNNIQPFSSAYKNESADLRLIYSLLGYLNMTNMFRDASSRIVYGQGIHIDAYKKYGTVENLDTGAPNTINNVSDATKYLVGIMSSILNIDRNDANYMNMKSLGDLHVYMDGHPMDFIPKK